MNVISAVYIFENNVVMTFDDAGQQLPEFQGQIDDVIPKLLAAGVELSKVLRSRTPWNNFCLPGGKAAK